MGGNIRDLAALHQVMRGEITLDKACEGMTDDFEIGHVSHRKDGDWRKVAQGKWVPVKADRAQKTEQTPKEYAERTRRMGATPHLGWSDEAEKKWADLKGKSTAELNGYDKKLAEYKEAGFAFDPKVTDLVERIKTELKSRQSGQKSYVDRGNVNERYKTDAKNMTTEQLEEKVKSLTSGAKGEPQEHIDEKIKIYTEELNSRKGGNAQFKMGDKVRIKKEFLNPGESQREYSIANINEKTGRAYVRAEGTGMKLAPQELVGMDMLERVPAEVNPIIGKPMRPETIAYAQQKKEDGAPLREGEKIPQKEIPDEIAPMIRHYNGLIDKWDKQLDSAPPEGETYQRIYGYIKNMGEQMDMNLSDPDVLEEHKAPMRDVKERLAGLKKKLIANGEKSAYGNRKHSGLEMLKENAKQLNEALAEGKKRGASVVEFTDSMGKTYKRYWNGARYEDKPSRMAEQYGGPDRPQGIYKATFQKSATDAAPVRLTADTKIKLSQIKREQTQDERRFYKPGEISQKTGLQKQQDGSWAPPKQGGAPASSKKSFVGSGSTKGHKWEAEKVGDKYISTHTWPDGWVDRTEITQKDYDTMKTTQRGNAHFKMGDAEGTKIKPDDFPKNWASMSTAERNNYYDKVSMQETVKRINSKTNNLEKRNVMLADNFKQIFNTKSDDAFLAMGELYSRVKKEQPHSEWWYKYMNDYDRAAKLYHDVIGSDNVDYYNKQIENLRMRPNYGQDPQETKIRESIKTNIAGRT